MTFEYGETETEYLKSRDRRLASVIDAVGHIERDCWDDVFTSIVRNIVGQQISSKAMATVWGRFTDGLGEVSASSLLDAGPERIQSFGISFRKTSYIMDFAHRVASGEFVPDALAGMSDDEAIRALSSLKGIGVWTAEMTLLFCLQRKNIFSRDDLAIQRGLRMIYRHREIGRELFEKYRRRFSPYCSVASLYIWAVAGGAVEGLVDIAKEGGRR